MSNPPPFPTPSPQAGAVGMGGPAQPATLTPGVAPAMPQPPMTAEQQAQHQLGMFRSRPCTCLHVHRVMYDFAMMLVREATVEQSVHVLLARGRVTLLIVSKVR
jgi:hypothetical protein